jgi:hypothetical protein
MDFPAKSTVYGNGKVAGRNFLLSSFNLNCISMMKESKKIPYLDNRGKMYKVFKCNVSLMECT